MRGEKGPDRVGVMSKGVKDSLGSHRPEFYGRVGRSGKQLEKVVCGSAIADESKEDEEKEIKCSRIFRPR
jgi:hypothetical protein